MRKKLIPAILLALLSGATSAQECSNLTPGSEAYETALTAMSGHFPVPLGDIQYCGVYGWSKLYTASIDSYKAYQGWEKSGTLRCWQLSQHKPGEPYGCGPTILSTHKESGTQLRSDYDIPLQILDEIKTALREFTLSSADIKYINYVPVSCGGAWSIATHGYRMQTSPKPDGSSRVFRAKKNCTPTPCLWTFEEGQPVRPTH